LRYHDPNNWPLLREALKAMGRADLIGNGKQHLIPTFQPLTDGGYQSARRSNSTPAGKPAPAGQGAKAGKTGSAQAQQPSRSSRPARGQILTQHTGLPPRAGVKSGTAKPARKGPTGR